MTAVSLHRLDPLRGTTCSLVCSRFLRHLIRHFVCQVVGWLAGLFALAVAFHSSASLLLSLLFKARDLSKFKLNWTETGWIQFSLAPCRPIRVRFKELQPRAGSEEHFNGNLLVMQFHCGYHARLIRESLHSWIERMAACLSAMFAAATFLFMAFFSKAQVDCIGDCNNGTETPEIRR